MKKELFLLVFLLAGGLFLRVFKLADRPAGFTWDEAALGYNAYSLSQTSRDEYGKLMPIVFKSFGDYKPGLYVYTSVSTVALLGLNEFAVRLPSAIAGTLLVLTIYLLVKHIFNGYYTALFSAGIVAINPWAIHFSRGAWEANLALLLTVLGVLLFVKKKYWQSFLFFGLTFWTYQGAKLFTPLLIVSLLFTYPTIINKLIKPGLLFILLLLPILWGIGSQSGRLKVFSVFSYTRFPEIVAEIMRQDNTKSLDLNYYLFHSEIFDQIRGIAQRYLNHFSPNFLFFTGDWTNGRHLIPYSGYFHLPEVILLIIGSYNLIKQKNRWAAFIFGWLFLAPLPAALSRDLVSGVRSLPMLVPLCIIAAVGLSKIFNKKILFVGYGLIITFFFVYFLDLYFIHAPFFTSSDWLVAYQPAWQIVRDNQEQYDRVIFTDYLGQPHIFALFYLHIDPRIYQSQARLVENSPGDVGRVEGFDKYQFRPIYWPTDRSLSRTLFVGGEYELPEQDLAGMSNVVRLGQINYPDNSVALRVVGIK